MTIPVLSEENDNNIPNFPYDIFDMIKNEASNNTSMNMSVSMDDNISNSCVTRKSKFLRKKNTLDKSRYFIEREEIKLEKLGASILLFKSA